jgi:hypothetical protein
VPSFPSDFSSFILFQRVCLISCSSAFQGQAIK